MDEQHEQADSDDDSHNNDMEADELMAEKEDPLLLAIDDLEGRVVAAIDDIKMYDTSSVSFDNNNNTTTNSIREQLASLFKPILEVAAHTAPSIARTYSQTNLEESVQLVYDRIVSDLILPVTLEMVQSDLSVIKRGVTLDFFKLLYKESTRAGSWLDSETASGLQAGPYGAGGGAHKQGGGATTITPVFLATMKRRQGKKLARQGEMLRYWVEASIACLQPGVFTHHDADASISSRGILAASSSLTPSLWHISSRIKDADDRGANRLYAPVMKMVEAVLNKLYVEIDKPLEQVTSACVKFMEILVLCCSPKEQNASAQRRKGAASTETTFSLDDLPTGHPIITRQALESIADYAFTALRGMVLLGGQLKMDANLLADTVKNASSNSNNGALPSAMVVSILKPAALAYLEIESNLPRLDDDVNVLLDYKLDTSSLEFDVRLQQKSHVLAINALSTLATNRPVFFKEAAVCLARRNVFPPVEDGTFNRSAVLVVTQALKASCLTLLRNSMSVTTNCFDCLRETLRRVNMETQAIKALSMAKQANALKTAGRAARNRANIYYEWDVDETGRQSKRQRETDDALAQMRAAKAARGLGHGIHLPTNMTEAIELVLLNLENLATTAPVKSNKEPDRVVPFTLEFLVDAILTNGASLSQEEGKWYERNGGTAFAVDVRADETVTVGSQLCRVLSDTENKVDHELFQKQCNLASANASSRIMANSSNFRSKGLVDISHRISARLAFTLRGVQPDEYQQASILLAKDSIDDVQKLLGENEANACREFLDTYPLAAAGLAKSATPLPSSHETTGNFDSSLALRLLNEALVITWTDTNKANLSLYDTALLLYIASTIAVGRLAKDKPSDLSRRGAASRSVVEFYQNLNKLPSLTKSSLLLVGALCDIDALTNKTAEALKKSQESVASSAAAHALKVVADKRATTALYIFRDAAFQRDEIVTRKAAVDTAVAVATGRLPSTGMVQDNARKLVMNLLFTRNDKLAALVIDAANSDLRYFADLAISSFDSIKSANMKTEKSETQRLNPLLPQSEEEKLMMDRLRPPALLFMAICVKKPDMIQSFFQVSSGEGADTLSKTVRSAMPILARAVAAQHGVAAISLQVASLCGSAETPLLLSFLENMAPFAGKIGAEDDLAEACFSIQKVKANEKGEMDPRFIIPVVQVMKRHILIERLPEFVLADEKILLAALVRMCDRQQRNALVFREEPDEASPSLRGMTFCEELVYLHQLDFAAKEIPQKQYLAAIKLCLEHDEIFTDRVVMAALEYMSGRFLAAEEVLPLAFMRTVILTCTKHESLQGWIANVLLTRLVDGKIYEDARQWEGWMRCAHMLEKSDDPSANAAEAIGKLPSGQLEQYQRKWAGR
ncbi:hypothetical protein MPSEU_000627300 [Mayamaea pseudoterrestris]|nr:hypothetical protein MPSEU_000627300 [Mayamaea pseudoterrestris]